jgi:hypothetical protein
MKQEPPLSMVGEIMQEFADRTGLTPAGQPPRRYLWTDAFGVCNFLELYQRTRDGRYQQFARQLVDQVHAVLGRHRADDARRGWISGLDEQEARRHPTIGGLRIGKPMNERGPDEPVDDEKEWDRDGQYFHYLTKWMHALNRMSRVCGDPTYNIWARELAKTVHARFVTIFPAGSSRNHIYWKMSIDLSRPLVTAMGHHDPLDGIITYNLLQFYATTPDLAREISDMAAICTGQNWATGDPLGLGGLLWNACHLAQLINSGLPDQSELLPTLLAAANTGLESFAHMDSLRLPADYRLAFRELGLSIGLRGVAIVEELVAEKPSLFAHSAQLLTHIDRLRHYRPMIASIEQFWLQQSNRESPTWTNHRDINTVMLATSLAPGAFLAL